MSPRKIKGQLDLFAESAMMDDMNRRPAARNRGYGGDWPKIRLAIIARDRGICQICGGTDHIQVDHIIPLSAGGTHHPNNLRVLCRGCNLRRRIMPPTWAQRGMRKVPANQRRQDTPPGYITSGMARYPVTRRSIS